MLLASSVTSIWRWIQAAVQGKFSSNSEFTLAAAHEIYTSLNIVEMDTAPKDDSFAEHMVGR